jgi:putative OPT family oligopeptide transporter
MRPLPEITVKAVILGVLLSVILAGANAYLGLFAGMTVSASIPAAVISMGILSLFRRSNILENNIVQTAASAGESLAAGVIFTIPALVLMGYWEKFDYFEIAKIAGLGGLIGVLFTIPLRRALILEAKLRYPEGVATAEVLRAGDRALHKQKRGEASGLLTITIGSLAGGAMKLAHQGFGLWGAALEGARSFRGAVFGFGSDLSPALVSVGYIVGMNIAVLVLAGGLISWLFAIPIYSYVTGEYPEANIDTAYEIWNAKIRYMGVGAMVVGGIYSIFKLIKPLVKSVAASLNAVRNEIDHADMPVENRDIPMNWVIIVLLCALAPLFLVYLDVIKSLPVALVLSVVMLVFGFLFSAVAGYMAGLVGSSNNPVSGITIATILFTSLLLLMMIGTGSAEGAAAAIIIGAVVCCAAAIAGDNMQDLKAGQLVGATPWKQQVMQIVGTVAAAFTLGITLQILHSAYTIGSETLSAPQATLMQSVAEGVFQGGLPWNFVMYGAWIGIAIIVADILLQQMGSSFRLHILAVAVGIYLPVTLSVPIFIGGLVSFLAKIIGASKRAQQRGLLFASGLITGEALMGIMVAVPIFITADKDWWPHWVTWNWLGLLLFIIVIIWLFLMAFISKNGSLE